MKQKQKKLVIMVISMATAVVLMVVKVGPIVLGMTSSPKNSAGKKKAAKAPPPAPSPQSRKPQEAPTGGGGPGAAPSVSLGEIKIDLSAVGRRVSVYEARGLRSPFGQARFELESKKAVPLKESLNLKLNGIVGSEQQLLAIIDGKVYAQGDEVAAGVTVVSIGADSAVLTCGETRVTLRLSAPDLKVRGP